VEWNLSADSESETPVTLIEHPDVMDMSPLTFAILVIFFRSFSGSFLTVFRLTFQKAWKDLNEQVNMDQSR